MKNTYLIALFLLLPFSTSFAHKFPLEQGVQDGETLRLEIIENVVNPCYVNIAWGKGSEATIKLGEDEVLAKMKLDAHDEIETTVKSITNTVKDLPHPSSRMAIYMHAVEKCLAGADNHSIGEVVRQDAINASDEKMPVTQAKANVPPSPDRPTDLWREVEENTMIPCVLEQLSDPKIRATFSEDQIIRITKARMEDKWENVVNAAYNMVKDVEKKESRMLIYGIAKNACIRGR